MTRNTTIFAAVALLAASAIPAQATGRDQPSNSNGPRATAGAQAGAAAAARASNRTTVRTTARATGGRATAAGGSSSATGGQGGTVNVTNAAPQQLGSSTQTLRTAPDVAAPAIWSNNPCIVSASGSVSVVGFGASIGAGIEDPDCTRRANAQLLSAMGQPDAAREVLCANREVREAFHRIGRPCVTDAQRMAMRSVAATQPQPAVTPNGEPVQSRQAPAPVNTSGLSDSACATLRARGMAVAGCP